VTPEQLSSLVKRRALELGFDSVGVTDLRPPPHEEELRSWLAGGMAGCMTYMHRQAEKRIDPSRIVPGAKRAVVLTKNYFGRDPKPNAGAGRVAKYARGRDYHDTLRPPLEALASYVKSLGGGTTLARAFIDAGPVPERELAQRAGLGWIGKNTMLIDPGRGSFTFLSTVFTNLDLAVDQPFSADRCGTCRRCLDACPTGALPRERVLDSRRCISYLTIEFTGGFDDVQEEMLGEWVFGCDVCQDVCPWNHKFASPDDSALLGIGPGQAFLDLEDLVAMTEEQFDAVFGTTPLARPGRGGVARNAQAVADNLARKRA